MDTDEHATKHNVGGIFELSKALLKRTVSVRYLHASDINLNDSTVENVKSATSAKNTSHSHHVLNLTSIDSLVRSEKGNSSKKEVEDLTTKSAFFVISETELIQEVLTRVRNYNSNLK